MPDRPADKERPSRATRLVPDLVAAHEFLDRRLAAAFARINARQVAAGLPTIEELAARYSPPIPSDSTGDNHGTDATTGGQHGR